MAYHNFIRKSLGIHLRWYPKKSKFLRLIKFKKKKGKKQTKLAQLDRSKETESLNNKSKNSLLFKKRISDAHHFKKTHQLVTQQTNFSTISQPLNNLSALQTLYRRLVVSTFFARRVISFVRLILRRYRRTEEKQTYKTVSATSTSIDSSV